MKTHEKNIEYAQMGIAALLPGMRHMLELMQRAYDEKQDLLSVLQQNGLALHDPPPLDNEEKKKPRKIAAGKYGWPSDPAERSAEMRRRIAVAKKKAKANAARTRYERMTKKQRAEWQKAMEDGRRRAAKQRRADEALAENGRAVA